jgi:hypothetical protein
MTAHIIAINNSDGHDPPLQFMVVDRFGLFVDLSKVHGQLFDPTVLEITWGERTMDFEKLATSDKATIVIERQPDGKMRVTSGS